MVLRNLALLNPPSPTPQPASPPATRRAVVSEPVMAELATGFARLRKELDLPPADRESTFDADVLAEAETACANPGDTPGCAAMPTTDLTDIPFYTVDPATAQDLDQALHIEPTGDGMVVYYAIADLTPFIAPGGAMDAEAWRRAQTVYLPDGKVPLHPACLSESAASLLPDQDRAAYVWQLTTDATGSITDATVQRAMVRSRRRCDYDQVQHALDTGTADDQWQLLAQFGALRADIERSRGGASLRIGSQEVHRTTDGSYELTLRGPLASEDFNAQVSLATGMAAADIMLTAGTGVLRTLPTPDPDEIDGFRRHVAAIGVSWAADQPYGEFLRTLDPTDPAHLAVMYRSRLLFRGAAYDVIADQNPADLIQAAVGAPYAHTTAPIRRLIDRYVLATCDALTSHQPVPNWVTDRYADLPDVMEIAGRRANSADRRATDTIECAVLADRVGDTLTGVVVQDRPGRRGNPRQVLIQCHGTPVVAWCDVPDNTPDLRGDTVDADLVAVDVAAGTLDLTLRTSRPGGRER